MDNGGATMKLINRASLIVSKIGTGRRNDHWRSMSSRKRSFQSEFGVPQTS